MKTARILLLAVVATCFSCTVSQQHTRKHPRTIEEARRRVDFLNTPDQRNRRYYQPFPRNRK